MDQDEIEMTREELQIFIRDSVNRRQLLTPDVIRKYRQLQMLLEKKEKLSTDLLQLFESVSKCEATVKQLYTKLGWEYKDTNSEGDDCNDNPSNCEATCGDELLRRTFPATNGITAVLSQEEHVERVVEGERQSPESKKELRVLLTRLPVDPKPRAQRRSRPNTSKRVRSEDELSDGMESDTLWQPSEDSSDSDFSISSSKSDRKKRKMTKLDKCAKTDAKATSVPQATSVPPASTNGMNITNSNKTAANEKPEVKHEMKPFSINVKKKPANSLPPVPHELSVGMHVLARRKKMRWESGKIAEIVEKEDGTKKFKVTFEDRGKMLVSGHHIAYDAMPKLVHLSVGGRVVSKCKSDQTFFSPGILAELPSRKNHMRFLVFFDDHTTLYVALPVLRVVCKPLPNPLDDIRNKDHKDFVKDYLERTPYPPMTQFRAGQRLKVELNGALEPCTVTQVDCSLMEVVFVKDEHKDWIYRGSIRLEHIINMKKDKQNK